MNESGGSGEDVAARLRAEMLAAYRPYVTRALRNRSIDVTPALERSIEAGEAWLGDALADLLGQPLVDQRRSPLEVFQEGLRFPTAVLAEAGLEPVERDEVERTALPGDHYRLAPASSQDLGEEVWRAHVAWGVAKAGAVAGRVPRSSDEQRAAPGVPAVALVSSDLMDRSKIEPVVVGRGLAFVVWRNPAAIEQGVTDPPALALVDLRHPAADDALRLLASAGVETVAFGPHVDDVALARARSLGAADALPRSRFFVRLPDLLPTLA